MNTAAVRDNWVGQVIDGKFPLRQWLGGSERSAVFLTELEGQGSRKAAVKLVPADSADAPAQLLRWQEASKLSHPHLIRLFHVGQCEVRGTALLYAVMEHSEENLSQILPQRPLTTAETGEMLRPVLDALSYVHQKGLVHGHIKPSNIMVVDERVKLSADSLSTLGETGNRSEPRTVYDAPEVLTGNRSPASDVWSLGVTLVDALTQTPPGGAGFDDSDPVLPESVPEPFRGIARDCLRRDPAARTRITAIKERLDGKAARTQAAVAPSTGSTKSRGVIPIAIAAAVIAIFVLAKLLSHSPQSSQVANSSQVGSPVAVSPTKPAAAEPKAAVASDSKGAVAEQVLPDVPRAAGRTIQGKVKVSVRVTVAPDGTVSGAKLESSGPSKYFANLALQAARKWKFKPPQAGGEDVSSAWILHFQFRQAGTDVAAVQANR